MGDDKVDLVPKRIALTIKYDSFSAKILASFQYIFLLFHHQLYFKHKFFLALDLLSPENTEHIQSIFFPQ